MTRWSRGRTVLWGLVVAALLVAAYAVFIAPFALTLDTESVVASVAQPLTVVQLSDLHTSGFGRRERDVVALVERAQPDLIVVTGDVVDSGALEPARPLFEKLHASLGVLVVRGNWENWNVPAGEAEFYRSVHATLLVNEGRLVRSDVWVAGVDDPLSGTADFAAARRGAPSAAVTIVLMHAPARFDEVARPGDLFFAGHTHGGQVRLPLVGPLWMPPGSGRFVDGWYEKSMTQGSARMFVSRGIGTSILPVRFDCSPEVVSVVIRPG